MFAYLHNDDDTERFRFLKHNQFVRKVAKIELLAGIARQ